MRYEMWDQSKTHASTVLTYLKGLRPCSACGKELSVAHSCHAVRQMAILELLTSNQQYSWDVRSGGLAVPPPPVLDPEHEVLESAKRRRLQREGQQPPKFEAGMVLRC